jgi:NAD(P)H dehydrogenase (quinone)
VINKNEAMKKILVINGHPVKDSYGSAIASSYIQGAESGKYSVKTINIREMDFNPNLMFGYKKRMDMEPDVENAIHQIQEADHIVWIYPMWWYGAPAILKGFIDRTFLPDIAFKSRKGKLPQKLFKNKSSRIIITSNTPRWYDYLFMKSPAINQLKKGTLGYSGIKPVKVSYIGSIKNSSDQYRIKWIKKVNSLGQDGV